MIRLRGFSMIEMMTAMSIGLVLLTTLTRGVVSFHDSNLAARTSAILDADAKVLSEYMSTRLLTAGGGGLRPWSSIFVNQGGTGLPDELTIVEFNEDFGECAIPALPQNANIGNVSIPNENGVPCCASDEWEGLFAYIISEDGTSWRHVHITNVNPNGRNCTITFNHQGTTDTPNSTFRNFNNATMAIADSTTYRLNQSENVLESVTRRGGGDVILPIAPDVYDLQFALGYDHNPEDGRVTDARSADDEWIGNAVGDTDPGDIATNLRRITMGVVLGARGKRNVRPASVLDGNQFQVPVTDTNPFHYRASETAVTFRNLFIFQ